LLHVPDEMDWQEGKFLDRDRELIICSIHGATYDPLKRALCRWAVCRGATDGLARA
jgi:hypothetical protein